MEAELEQQDVAGGPDRQQVRLHDREPVGEPAVGEARVEALHGGRVGVHGDHVPRLPGVLDELSAARAHGDHRAPGERVERGQVPDDLGEVGGHVRRV